jgi:multiple sugar transport system permease protein
MALLGHIEARSIGGRLFHAAIVFALFVGGMTMIYPFAVMLSGSIRSEMDQADLDVVPAFWFNTDVLYQKFLETKYNQDVDRLNSAHQTLYFSFRNAMPPQGFDQEAQRMNAFMTDPDLPQHWQVLGGMYGMQTVPEAMREMRRRVYSRFDGDFEALSRALGSPMANMQMISFRVPEWLSRRYDIEDNVLTDVYYEVTREASPADRQLLSITGDFLLAIVYPRYGRSDVDAFNATHVQQISDYADFRLPATVPGEDDPVLREEWIEFASQELHPSFIVLTDVTQEEYDAFVASRHVGQQPVSYMLPDGRRWLSGLEREIYQEFIETQPVEKWLLVGPEFEFGQETFSLAQAAMEHQYVIANANTLRWTYSLRNYINVFDELVFQGRVLFNTVVYCTLCIVLALLVNPLAAYAMSRYQLKGTYKVLLFPQFIMLRNFNLLNSFTALVLPLVANGYMIFLLKGFFDSLPRELYEAARIDGASEIRMFFQITMALSKPILAVLALGTFTGAYMMFLYPLLVAPDEDMWLIAVWLYQFQQRSSTPGVYASVVLASIPTLIIFLFAQRTIMRGIVVPTEK